MRIYILFGLFWGMIGCISDDIPLPVIYGNVQKIEFNGQQKCVINTKTRTIELTLSDTVDIKRVYLNTLEITADPAREQSVDIVPATSLKVDSFVDLSKPFPNSAVSCSERYSNNFFPYSARAFSPHALKICSQISQ